MRCRRHDTWALALTPLNGAAEPTPEQARAEARLLARAAANVRSVRMGEVSVALRGPRPRAPIPALSG
jgi:hypothetical protein